MIRGFSIFSVCLVALVGLALAAKHPMDAIDSYQLASGQLVGIPLFIVLLYRGVEVGDVALGFVAAIGFGLSVWSIWLTLRST